MKKFLIQILAFTSIPLIVLVLTTIYYADGYIDSYYLRFTTPKQENLIIGTSKAAQGIIPSILESHLNRKFFNFCFTINHSPYGESYYKSISKKINKNAKNGIFILSVDPFGITSYISSDGKENLKTEVILGNMFFVNMNPNFEYIFRNNLSPWRKVFSKDPSKISPKVELHEDGWLEVDFKWTQEKFKKNKDRCIKEYRNLHIKRVLSKNRIHYLEKTIKLLQQHGTVYLVRIPTAKEMFDVENELVPNFNEYILKISKKYNVHYFNCSEDYDIYQTTDGNHLYKPSGIKFTEALCDSIRMYKK